MVTSDGLFSGVFTDVEYSGSVRACVVESDVGILRIEAPSASVRPEKGDSVRLDIAPSALHMVRLA